MDNDKFIEDKSIINKFNSMFPFALFFLSVFITGLTFILLNSAIFVDLLSGKHYKTIQDVILNTVVNNKFVPNNLNLSTLLFYSFISTIIGFIINMFSRLISTILVLSGRLLTFFKIPGFTAINFLDGGKPELYSWLIKHKEEKLEWEWNLFNYTLYWGFTTNGIIFFFIIINLLTTTQLDLQLFTPLVVMLVFLIFYSFMISVAMGNANQFFEKKMKRD